ncbi:MAG: class II glutamine amidotransferase [Burkholderiales bacterium]|nr:class II glutamine amidotransferase [Burkholderiales bacterium]
MCQLLGMNCNTPTDIIFSFTGFVPRAGITDHHSDGWGIAFFEGIGVRHFVDHYAAIHSPLAELVKSWPIKSTNVIAHIRKATQGRIALENCHPFVRQLWGRNWVFAHNGDLKEFHPTLEGLFTPIGCTDSERAFCYLLQAMQQQFGNNQPPRAELAEFLQQQCHILAQYGTFNLMFSDGDALYVHCSTNLHYIVRQHPFASAALADEEMHVDFSQLTSQQDRVAIIATSPLTNNEIWCQMSPGQFIVFVDGMPQGEECGQNRILSA